MPATPGSGAERRALRLEIKLAKEKSAAINDELKGLRTTQKDLESSLRWLYKAAKEERGDPEEYHAKSRQINNVTKELSEVDAEIKRLDGEKISLRAQRIAAIEKLQELEGR